MLPWFYNKSLEIMFSRPLKFYVDTLYRFALVLKNYPILLGFFYGCCLLSFYLRAEFPDSSFFYFISSFFLVARNLMLIPFLGLNFLIHWVLSRIHLEVEKKDVSSDIFSFLKAHNDSQSDFKEFDRRFFSSIPLIGSTKSLTNYTTRRTMFHVIRSISAGIPGKEQIPTVIRSTLGTTVTGGMAIGAFTAGVQSDDAVRNSHEKTLEMCGKVLENTESTQTQRYIARELRSQAETNRDEWFHDAGSSAVVRGAKILTDQGVAPRLKGESHQITLQAIELEKITHFKGSLGAKEMTYFIERHGFQKFQVPSPLENFFSFGNFF